MLNYLPTSINFSDMGADIEEPIDFGVEDRDIEGLAREDSFLFVLKVLPKDRYRVIALLLFIKYEMGYHYDFTDIASIWGHSKANVANTIKRMKEHLSKQGVAPTSFLPGKGEPPSSHSI